MSFIDTVASSVTEKPDFPDETEVVELLMKLEEAVTALRLYSSECVSEEERKIKFNDKQNKKIASLVRGKLCTALANVIGHNLKSTILLRKIHLWNFIEACTSEVTHANVGALSIVNAVRTINSLPTTDPNMKFRCFICDALNNKSLATWLKYLTQNYVIIDKFYEDESLVRLSDVFQKFITCLSTLPLDIPFSLSLDYEFSRHPTTTPTPTLTVPPNNNNSNRNTILPWAQQQPQQQQHKQQQQQSQQPSAKISSLFSSIF